jgi:hypothetical protein
MEQLSCAVTTRAANPRGLRLLFTRKYLPQLAMATVIPAAQQLTGINAIMYVLHSRASRVCFGGGGGTGQGYIELLAVATVKIQIPTAQQLPAA